MAGPLVIYHANCLDGFGAAYAAQAFFGADGCEPIPARHGQQPPVTDGNDLYLLDFAYDRRTMTALCETAGSITVIDHHITAAKELEGLDRDHPNLRLIFDMEKSGAVLAWEHFHDRPVPLLFLYIQDRDLWHNAMPDSAAVNAALMSYRFDFALWQRFVEQPEQIEQLVGEGRAVDRFRRRMIEHYKKQAVFADVAGFTVPVVNCPREIASELLEELAENQPFAAGYQDLKDRRGWSLRSKEDGVDVAAIAEQFGGGGHKRAAGFAEPIGPRDAGRGFTET